MNIVFTVSVAEENAEFMGPEHEMWNNVFICLDAAKAVVAEDMLDRRTELELDNEGELPDWQESAQRSKCWVLEDKDSGYTWVIMEATIV